MGIRDDMIRIENIDDIITIKCPVSEFVFSMTYCEYKIPFFLDDIKAPRDEEAENRKTIGLIGHRKEEIAEIKKLEEGEIEEITTEQLYEILPDIEKDIEFTREDIRTKLYYHADADEKKVELTLSGRADKVLRKDTHLIVHEDKFPKNPYMYVDRKKPFDNQILQALIYLNSKFLRKNKNNNRKNLSPLIIDDMCGWVDTRKIIDTRMPFEIPHNDKKWIVNIKDITEGIVVKSFEGFQTDQERSYLENNLLRFIDLVLSKKDKIHHNNIRKCIPCGYSSICLFSMK